MLVLFLRRTVAYVTDSMLMLIFVRPATFAQRFLGDLDGHTYFAFQLVAIVITALYIVGSHARWGCTLGKGMFHLRVATVDGAMPPPLTNAWLRWVLLDIAAALLTHSRRSLHDMFARTVVIERAKQAMQG